ncbi:MAG: chemotaxis protein CheR [Hyphomicrobiales bacterium]|nr:MAG: chemotaxis protein CheR [Hyphomicrobiales bacterium]
MVLNASPLAAAMHVHQRKVLSKYHFEEIAALLRRATGIALHSNKLKLVETRLADRLNILDMDGFQQYLDFITSPSGKAEHEHLINALTTNLTRFFREHHHFDYLDAAISTDNLIPSRKTPLRVWSAGCSSGEEPYSIALTLWANKQFMALNNVKILATDIDTEMLEAGALGQYSKEALKDLSQAHKNHFQETSADRVQIADNIKAAVFFRRLNLVEAWPMSKQFDVIFCRNVAIYFEQDTQKQIFERMGRLLKPGGTLFVGHSENLNVFSNCFKLVAKSTYKYIGG